MTPRNREQRKREWLEEKGVTTDPEPDEAETDPEAAINVLATEYSPRELSDHALVKGELSALR